MFSREFCEISKNIFFTEYHRWLLLFLMLTSIVLLQVHASFLTFIFSRFITPLGFIVFYIVVDHFKTSQLINNSN